MPGASCHNLVGSYFLCTGLVAVVNDMSIVCCSNQDEKKGKC